MSTNSGYNANNIIYKFFDNSHFREFFELNDAEVMTWALTVMEKLYDSGVIPSYFDRNSGNDNLFEDEDFISFFYSQCHFYAIVVVYNRLFENIESNDILKRFFLENIGLYFKPNETEVDLNYIFQNYVSEFRNRGTLSVISKKGENGNQVDGELLRLVNYKTYNEYIFAQLGSHEIGWNLSNSSPLYRGCNKIVNLTKAYEFTEDVTDLSLYPLLSVSDVNIVNNKMRFTHTTGVNGLSLTDNTQLIPINRGVSYEISFRIECDGDLSKITFGVSAFNEQGISVNLIDATTGSNSLSNYFLEDSYVHKIPDQEVWVRAAIYANDETDLKTDLNIGFGTNLKFNNSCEFICPKILIDNTLNSVNIVDVRDIKIRPLKLPYSLGQLGARNFTINYLKNNSGKFTEELENIIKTEILPYNINYQPIYLD